MNGPARAGQGVSSERGMGLPEVLTAILLVALLAAGTAPVLGEALRRHRLESITRALSTTLHGARWRALASGRHAGLRLEHRGRELTWTLHEDGDGDGLRRDDLDSGTDPAVGPAVRLGQAAPGVEAAVLDDVPVPRLPPQTGLLPDPDDAVKFGSSNLVSFGPTGGGTSGSLYLTDGRRMTALVLDGVTGRIRLFHFERTTLNWKEMHG